MKTKKDLTIIDVEEEPMNDIVIWGIFNNDPFSGGCESLHIQKGDVKIDLDKSDCKELFDTLNGKRTMVHSDESDFSQYMPKETYVYNVTINDMKRRVGLK
jgi:hypothetical protein